MAGIGFELRRMIDEREGLLARVRAYVCAGLISAGPWLMTIFTMSIISLFGRAFGGDQGYETFRSLVTFCYAFSLILVGIGQMALTRRVADFLYSRQYQKILGAFSATLVAVASVSVVIGCWFTACAGFDLAVSCLAVILFAVVGMTWVALIWLSIVREFDEVLRAYAYGMLGTLCLLPLCGDWNVACGLLAAYTAGHALTLWLLIRVIVRAMDQSGQRDWSVLGSIKLYPELTGVGLLYNAAIWVDKMVFWFVDGTGAHRWLRFHPLYDTCCYLAYLTVVPALAINLIWLETAFYDKYRDYFGSILGGHPLRLIEQRREEMQRNLKDGAVRLLRVQGFLTALCIVFAPFIVRALDMEPAAIGIFRRACLGALFHVLLLITLLVQLYFDFRKEALLTALSFFVLNGALAIWSVAEGVRTYATGYASASFLSLCLAFYLLHRGLDQLEFRVFSNQAIGSAVRRGLGQVMKSRKRRQSVPPIEERTPASDPKAVDAAAGEWSWEPTEEIGLVPVHKESLEVEISEKSIEIATQPPALSEPVAPKKDILPAPLSITPIEPDLEFSLAPGTNAGRRRLPRPQTALPDPTRQIPAGRVGRDD